ncbi:MAG: hypothetical protein LBT08_01620 [Synergistaceae bacterium]|nr:hypothetical protein [Synergistaceae bacterium]
MTLLVVFCLSIVSIVITLLVFSLAGDECHTGEMFGVHCVSEAVGYGGEGWKDFITIYVSN